MVNKPGNCVRNQIPIHNMVQPHRFTRDMLESMRVLQQLDEKFIVGVVSYRGEILIIHWIFKLVKMCILVNGE